MSCHINLCVHLFGGVIIRNCYWNFKIQLFCGVICQAEHSLMTLYWHLFDRSVIFYTCFCWADVLRCGRKQTVNCRAWRYISPWYCWTPLFYICCSYLSFDLCYILCCFLVMLFHSLGAIICFSLLHSPTRKSHGKIKKFNRK